MDIVLAEIPYDLLGLVKCGGMKPHFSQSNRIYTYTTHRKTRSALNSYVLIGTGICIEQYLHTKNTVCVCVEAFVFGKKMVGFASVCVCVCVVLEAMTLVDWKKLKNFVLTCDSASLVYFDLIA